MKKVVMVLFFIVALFVFEKAERVYAYTNITQNECDINVIPDKYSTGVREIAELEKFSPGKYDGVAFSFSGDSVIKVEFWSQRDLSGVYYFENIDFSERTFRTYNADKLNNDVVFVFTNCNFDCVSLGEVATRASYIFNNCSFVSCYGSNMELNNCYIAGGAGDGVVPYVNATFNSCYIADKSRQNTLEGKGAHTDGTQIYGSKKGGASNNIHYYNCRFELPQLLNSSATMNACIMFQMEFADAFDISFEKCYVNGGGYSIYTRAIKGYSLENIVLDDILVGCAARWGTYCECPTNSNVYDEGVTRTNIRNVERLYVGSVWQDCGTHISVTNDTNDVRTLLVLTSNGEQLFEIPACYKYYELTENTSFQDYPFDIDINVGETEWVVCYDVTGDDMKQIRCKSFDGNYFVDEGGSACDNNYTDDKLVADDLEVDETVGNIWLYGETIASGDCGKYGNNVSWTLFSDGTLVLTGEGETDAYHSKKLAPWRAYSENVTSVVVEEGITALGAQLFNQCTKIVSVSLPNTLQEIGGICFQSCVSLKKIEIPSGVKNIKCYTFNGVSLDEFVYGGLISELKVDEKNGNINRLLK